MPSLVLTLSVVGHCSAQTAVFDLADETRGRALIAAGAGLEPQARRLAAMLSEATNGQFEMQAAGGLIEADTWRMKESALSRPLILLGNVVNNEAMFSLYSHWLEGANAAYPGPGRYVLRTLFEPLRRGKHILTLGASDEAGVEAGLTRLGDLLRTNHGKFVPIIELGSASGPDKPGGPSPAEFAWAATEFFWHGTPPAGAKARQLLLDEMSRRNKGLWGFDEGGHYDWERNYRPLLQLLATGLLSEEERQQVDARLVTNVLDNTDWAFLAYANAPVEQSAAHLDRHQLSALLGGFIVLEYLQYVGRVPTERREAVRLRYEHFLGHCRTLVEGRHFCTQVTGNEGGDTLNMLADLYLQYGDRRVVTEGTLRRMADGYLGGKDNLGWHACDDSYIGARPGCHFARSAGGATWLLAGFLYRDAGYRWLLDNMHTFLTHFQVARPPETAALLAHLAPEEPKRYHGVTAEPLDPYWFRQCSERAPDETAVPVKAPVESLFSRATFREGFNRDDAYLLFQGTDRGSLNAGYSFMANSITRYTELGSLLLFANSMKQTGWSHSLVSASRGQPDPQSTACLLETSFTSERVSGLQSLHEQHGGMRWTRSLVRRQHGYFVVLDRLAASEADTYLMVCRWRSFHPGVMVGPSTFEAVDGMNQVRFRLASASPAAWKVETEKQDGAARPTVVRQIRRERLRAGESTAFGNVFYATDSRHPRDFAVRSLPDTAVLIRGRAEGIEELTAVGVERISLPGVTGDVRLWYASASELALSGVRQCRLADGISLAADQGFNLRLSATGGPGSIEGPADRNLVVKIGMKAAGALRVDGKPLAEGEVTLPPGRHTLEVAEAAALLAGLKTALSNHWAAAKPAETLAAPRLDVTGQAALAPMWEQTGVPPPLSEHGNVRLWAEPQTQIGEAATWRNRLIGPPYGYGWHGSERAGWLKGTTGTVVMDLGSVTEVADIQLVRSRRANTEAGAFNPGEFEFDLTLSNDNFQRDLRQRTVKDPAYSIYYRQNTQYTYTQRFPLFTVPVQARARYVKLVPRRVLEVRSPPADYYGTYTDDEISFMGVFVHRTEREPRREASLSVVDTVTGPASLYQADTTLRMVSTGGKVLWEKTTDAPPAAPTQVADVDGDGRPEILVFTLAETLTAFRAADGSVVFSVDVKDKLNTAATSPGMSPYRPCSFAAWRPDSNRQEEVWFFPHYNCVRVLPGPDHACQRLEQPGGNRGGKFGFTVPDVTGDGREDLAVVGLYGNQFGVIASEASVDKGTLASYLAMGPLKGYSSGNMELPLYWSGGFLKDSHGKWLGVFALNPGGINFYRATDFKEQWSHFNHPPNSSCVVADLDKDGFPEILVGREDGYVLAYAVRDGSLVARAALDGAVRSLASTGTHLVAGTEQGLVLLDRRLTPLTRRPGPVEAVAAVTPGDGEPLIAAVSSSGRLVGLRCRLSAVTAPRPVKDTGTSKAGSVSQ